MIFHCGGIIIKVNHKLPNCFIIGAPKAGTTWLSDNLSKHPEISMSNPKEPDIVATHKGTFGRDFSEPKWKSYDACFDKEGLRIDSSIHTFACPLAPKRIADKIPHAKLILCLREPVERSVSHWRMIVDLEADKKNGTDWTEFNEAWKDNRLRQESLYGQSIQNWLEYFPISQIHIIDSERMKNKPEYVMHEIEKFLGINHHTTIVLDQKNANKATDRRIQSNLGNIVAKIASKIPFFLKAPIVYPLELFGINIYRTKLLTSRNSSYSMEEKYYQICGKYISKDLELFQEKTNFSTEHWIEIISDNSKNKI